MPNYSVVDVADLPGEGPGGVVKKVRKALDARAFGFNWFELPGERSATSTTRRRRARKR